MRIFVALTALMCSFALSTYSQDDTLSSGQYLQVGLGFVGFSYIGDFTSDANDLYRIHPGGNLSLQTTGTAALQLQANVGFGAFEEQLDRGGVWSSSDALPNKFVETSFYYGDLRLKYRFLRKKRFQPYLAVGAGLLVFTPRNEAGKLLREMPETRADGEAYNTTIPQLPAVAGVQARISPWVAASLDYTYRLTPTDYLDNVGQWGSRAGHDALQGIQLSLYVTFRSQRQQHPAAPALPPDTALAQQPVPVIAPTEIANSQEIQEPVSAPQEMEAARPEASLPENEQAQESYVAQEKAALENRQYVYYEVKPGDDLAEIAKRFHVRVETIVHLNYLGNQNLSAGTYLRLPDMGIPTEE